MHKKFLDSEYMSDRIKENPDALLTRLLRTKLEAATKNTKLADQAFNTIKKLPEPQVYETLCNIASHSKPDVAAVSFKHLRKYLAEKKYCSSAAYSCLWQTLKDKPELEAEIFRTIRENMFNKDTIGLDVAVDSLGSFAISEPKYTPECIQILKDTMREVLGGTTSTNRFNDMPFAYYTLFDIATEKPEYTEDIAGFVKDCALSSPKAFEAFIEGTRYVGFPRVFNNERLTLSIFDIADEGIQKLEKEWIPSTALKTKGQTEKKHLLHLSQTAVDTLKYNRNNYKESKDRRFSQVRSERQ